MKVNLLF